MSRQNKDMPKPSAVSEIHNIKSIKVSVGFADFTDGGGAAGTFDLTTTIPAGAVFLKSTVRVPAGFAGDTSAVMTIGDGTDVDRYNTSTINVFATAATGVAAGIPSGERDHFTAATVRLTVTSGADWGSVTAGRVVVTLYYI
jgi:hypothetical protein